jgi:nucleoid DNA-binding protein
MRKVDLIVKVSKKTTIHKVDVKVILEAFFEESKNHLIKGESVHMPNLGDLVFKKRRARKGRDMINNTEIPIPERLLITIDFANDIKQQVRERNKLKT